LGGANDTLDLKASAKSATFQISLAETSHMATFNLTVVKDYEFYPLPEMAEIWKYL
jgi:hypothetical protein